MHSLWRFPPSSGQQSKSPASLGLNLKPDHAIVGVDALMVLMTTSCLKTREQLWHFLPIWPPAMLARTQSLSSMLERQKNETDTTCDAASYVDIACHQVQLPAKDSKYSDHK